MLLFLCLILLCIYSPHFLLQKLKQGDKFNKQTFELNVKSYQQKQSQIQLNKIKTNNIIKQKEFPKNPHLPKQSFKNVMQTQSMQLNTQPQIISNNNNNNNNNSNSNSNNNNNHNSQISNNKQVIQKFIPSSRPQPYGYSPIVVFNNFCVRFCFFIFK